MSVEPCRERSSSLSNITEMTTKTHRPRSPSSPLPVTDKMQGTPQPETAPSIQSDDSAIRKDTERQRSDIAIKEFVDRISLYSEIYSLITIIFKKNIEELKSQLTGSKREISQKKNDIDKEVDRFVLEATRNIEQSKANGSNFKKALTEKISQWNNASDNKIKFTLTFWKEFKIICFHLFIGKWAFRHIINPFINSSINEIRTFLYNPENTLELCEKLSNKAKYLFTSYIQQKQLPQIEEITKDTQQPENDTTVVEQLIAHFNKNVSSINTNISNRNQLYETFCIEIMRNYFPSLQLSSTIKSFVSLSFWQPKNIFLKGIKLLTQLISQVTFIMPILGIVLFEKILNPLIQKKTELIIHQKFPKMIHLLLKNIQIECWKQASSLIKQLHNALAFSFFIKDLNFDNLNIFFKFQYLNSPKFCNNIINYLSTLKINSIKSIFFFFKLKEFILAGQDTESLPDIWINFEKTPSEEQFKALLTHILNNPRSKQKFEGFFNNVFNEDRRSTVSAKTTTNDSELFPDLFPENIDDKDLSDANELAKKPNLENMRRNAQNTLKIFSRSFFQFINFETCTTQQQWQDKQHKTKYFQSRSGWIDYNTIMNSFANMLPKALENGIFSGLILGINKQLHPNQLESQISLLFHTMKESITSNGGKAANLEGELIKNEQEFKHQIDNLLTDNNISTIIKQQIQEQIWQEPESQEQPTSNPGIFSRIILNISSFAKTTGQQVTDTIATRQGNIQPASDEIKNYLNDIADGLSKAIKNDIVQKAFIDRLLVVYTDRNFDTE